MLNILLLAFTIITWGYSWVLMKQSLDYMSPFTFVALRNSVGAIFLLLLIFPKNGFKLSYLKRVDYIVIGIFQTALMFALIIYGMKYVEAGKTSIILYTMPIWTAVLLHFFMNEKLTVNRWVAVCFGLFGIFFIMGWDTVAYQDRQIIFGELLIVLAAISWSVANIWHKRFLKSENPSITNCYQLIIGSLFLVLLVYISEGTFEVNWNYHSLFIILFTGIIASSINFTIWFYLINKFDINTTTFSSLLVPVFGLSFDWLILGTKLNLGVAVGTLLILVAIYKISKENLET